MSAVSTAGGMISTTRIVVLRSGWRSDSVNECSAAFIAQYTGMMENGALK
jgi:hypothetical protein